MEHACDWSNLHGNVLIPVVQRLSCIEDYIRFTAVCKSWKSATEDYKPLLPPKYPLLLLAEDVVPGSIVSDGEYDSDGGYSSEHYDEDEEDEDDADEGKDHDAADDDSGDHVSDHDDEAEADNDHEEEHDNDDDAAADDNGDHGEEAEADHDNNDAPDEDANNNSEGDDSDDSEAKKHVCAFHGYDCRNNSIGSSRGLYSLSTGKTYMLELPEASGRLILGANHGWLLTLGRDLQIHLLHPLLRYQIPLPPMLTLPKQYQYAGNLTPEERSDVFIQRAILSSKVAKKDGVNLHDTSSLTPPVVMVSYGQCGMYSAFCRFGDEEWTHVDIQSRPPDDFVYHKGRFYMVNNGGQVFVYDIQNKEGARATKIGSLPYETFQDRKYLVESISGTLFLLVHKCKTKHFYPVSRRTKYRTIGFLVWKVELQYSDDPLEIPSCTLIKEYNLGNQAIFVGRGSSVAVSPSETIRPNCIYFTDSREDCYRRRGGGHDMGIFNMEDHTIEPHFPGKSIHFISPPLWYI